MADHCENNFLDHNLVHSTLSRLCLLRRFSCLRLWLVAWPRLRATARWFDVVVGQGFDFVFGELPDVEAEEVVGEEFDVVPTLGAELGVEHGAAGAGLEPVFRQVDQEPAGLKIVELLLSRHGGLGGGTLRRAQRTWATLAAKSRSMAASKSSLGATR